MEFIPQEITIETEKGQQVVQAMVAGDNGQAYERLLVLYPTCETGNATQILQNPTKRLILAK